MQFNSKAHDQGAARRQAGNNGLAQFMGQGDSQLALSDATRRRIMQALRKACAVMGPGQKSRIGRLGGGAALGALAMTFAPPAMAQYAAGGGSAPAVGSVAIGTGAGAANINGVAMGTSNTATGDGAVAIGNNNSVNSFDGVGAIVSNGVFDRAIGGNFVLPNGSTGINSYAVGIGASNTVAVGGLAVGTSNQANGGGVTAIAIGLGNASTGGFGVSLGVGNRASATSAVSIGTANTASGNTAIAMGRQSTASGQTSVALGNVSTASQTNAIAIGHSAQATGLGAIAMGGGTNSGSTSLDATAAIASGAHAIALGTTAAAGINALGGGIAIGYDATAGDITAGSSLAIGIAATATSPSNAGDSLAMGRSASATGQDSMALGGQSVASGTNSIAIGNNSTTATNSGSVALGVETDATGANATALGINSVASGTSAVALGNGAIASGSQSISIGTGNNVSGANSGAIGDPNTVTGSGSYALGNNNTINANNAFAIGNAITIAAGRNGSVGIGDGTTVAAPNTGAFTLNGGTAAATAPTAVVSVGAAGAERQVTNVAAGVVSATSTDAVNGSQLFTVATAANNLGDSLETVTGGGLVINPNGTIATPPSISAAGGTYANTTAAIQALDSANTTTNNALASALGGGTSVAANGAVTGPSYVVGGTTYTDVGSALGALDAASGTGPVQYANAGTPTVPNGGTASQNVTLVGAAPGAVAMDNLAAGSLAAGSTQAVNGGQVNTLGSSVAAQLGAGSTFNPATGQVTAPGYTVAGGAQSDVGTAFAALDTANTTANTGIATAIGGGMAIAADGTVTAPAVTVGSTTYSNLTDAIQAAGAGYKLTTAAGGTGIASGISVEDIGAGETVTLTAGNNITTTQIGNTVRIALNPALTGIDSLAISGGLTIDSTGIAMNGDGITGLTAGSTLAGSTEAVNGGQLNTALASVASNLGGGSLYDPVTGTVTAPSYTVDGSNYADVGAALTGVDTALSGLTGGTSGLVQQTGGAPGAGPITVGAATGGTSVSLAGTAGDRVLTGMGAGAVTATSNEAVNGSQIFANQQQLAGMLGGGATVNPLTGVISAPNYTVAGGAQANVGDALAALDGKADSANAGLAAALGGGASIAPDGTVTAPAYVLGTTTYGDVGSALTALSDGTAGLVQQVGGAPGAGQITLGAATGGTSLSLAGTAGDRAVSGVAAGTVASGSTEAVNGGQLFALVEALGMPGVLAGIATPPSYNIGGTTYDNAAAAFGAVNTAISGGGIKYFRSNSVMSETVPVGTNATAMGPVAGVAGENAIAIGVGANAAGLNTIAIGTGNVVTGAGSGAIGDPNTITGSGSYALGNNNTIDANNAFVMGNGVTIAAGNDGSVALGDASTVSAPSTGARSVNGGAIAAATASAVVSVGSAGGERQLTNLAAGTVSATSTDAVNGSQLYAVGTALNTAATGLAGALGGGAAVAPDGTVTAPSYTVAGGTQSNVGAALTALDTAVTGLASGTSGIVQQTGGSPGSGTITVGAASGGTLVNMAGTGGDRRVTGVAAPTAGNDAVNRTFVDTVGQSVAAGLGGGAAYDAATGTVTAPAYSVGGQTYADAGAALAASNRLAVQYVPDAAGAPTNTVRLTGDGSDAAVRMTNLAAGAVSAASSDAVTGSQLFAVQQSAVTYDSNPDGSVDRTSVRLGAVGAPVALRNVAAGTAASDAVNLGQMQAGLQSGLAAANAYTDLRMAGIAFDLNKVAKRAYAGTAAALALQSPALFSPGAVSMRGGVGVYRGEWAFGLGIRATADNGRWSLSGGISAGRNSGIAASAGVDFVFGD